MKCFKFEWGSGGQISGDQYRRSNYFVKNYRNL